MNLVVTVLQIVAPVFLMAGIGFAWRKAGFDYPVTFVTRLSMTIAVPSLVFTALMKTQVAPDALSAMFAGSVLAHLFLGVVVGLLAAVLRLDRRTFVAPLVFGNTGNLGLPLMLFAFGSQGLGLAVVFFAVSTVLSFSLGIWVVSGHGTPFRALKEPMVWAAVLGALFQVQGWQTPAWLTNGLELAGQMAIPLMLMTLGVAVARLSPRGMSRALLLSLAKLVLALCAGWAAGRAAGLDGVAFKVLLMQTATPVAVSSYLLAERYGADAEAVAALVVVSTLLSVLTLPLLLGVLL